jgi:hypothetical protein
MKSLISSLSTSSSCVLIPFGHLLWPSLACLCIVAIIDLVFFGIEGMCRSVVVVRVVKKVVKKVVIC